MLSAVRGSSKIDDLSTSNGVGSKINGSANAAEANHNHALELEHDRTLHDNIHDLLHGLRLDEVVTFAQTAHSRRKVTSEIRFPWSIIMPLEHYLLYLITTWRDLVHMALSREIPLYDLFGAVFIAAATSVVLFFVLLWCQFAHLPLSMAVYQWFSERFGNGLGPVNVFHPGMFESLTSEQINAAKEKLGSKPVHQPNHRVFDLDIAKLMLQIASIVYERHSDSIHGTLRNLHDHFDSEDCATGDKPRLSASSKHKRRKAGQNAMPNGDADGANGTAEHDEDSHHVSHAGHLLRDSFGHGVADRIHDMFHETRHAKGADTIKNFCRRADIQFAAVSELNNRSSAFCSFFWDDNSNWITVAFKGTGLTEFDDFVTDLTTALVHVDDFLPGFDKVVKGFRERIYPHEVSDIGGQRPYDTIRYALCHLADHLSAARGGQRINVWFTGHSLGCALATLVYTRALAEPDDFVRHSMNIRDAYLFAAPIAGNRPSRLRFNAAMLEDRTNLRTMWRVTNAEDAIATLLPQLGDKDPKKLPLSDTNPAGYAHLGVEIKMKDHPHVSSVAGNMFGDDDTIVEIRSSFTPDEILAARKKLGWGIRVREKLGVLAQNIPLLGRFIAHDTVLYWFALDRMGVGYAKWEKEH